MNDRHCSQTDCDQRTGCQMGELDPNDCKYHFSNDGPQNTDGIFEIRTPWHGSVLGLADLQYVAARGRPHLIGLIGAHNAGKTTFLTTVYLKLFQGTRVGDKKFAGSFSLRAWEDLANNLRYPNDTVPMFPRHTPNTEDRVPGLLHIAFRNNFDRLEDYLFTDAPGEWFSNWSHDRDADNAKGARWVARHSDSFLFFVDCEQLSGENAGIARNAITQLAQRLADEVGDRPVRVLWSKIDVGLAADIREQIESRLRNFLPSAKHFEVTVHDPSLTGIQSILDETLGGVDYRGSNIVLNVPSTSTEPFFSFRSI